MEKSFDQTYKLFLVLFAVHLLFSGYLFYRLKSIEKKGVPAVQAAAPGTDTTAPAGPEPTPDTTNMPPVTDADHIRGSKDADIVMVEYSDFECPFCKNFAPTVEQVRSEYGDKVGFVYRHYPLSFHPKAQKSAEASECVAELGGEEAFWSFHDTMFERMPDVELSQLGGIAAELGVDQTAFQSCLDSGKYAQKVKDSLEGGNKAGVSGTPGTILISKNGKRDFVSGAYPFDAVKAQIDALLQ